MTDVFICPVCAGVFSEAQPDMPDLSECMTCGSEWITATGEIIFNAREDI